MTRKTPVRLVNDSVALLSMRESDFDSYSAFGEVVDNSIQAKATAVKVLMQTAAGHKKGYDIVKSIAFGDNGTGMPADVLHRCLQLGYSTRYNDRSGIGRFGVGMTLAAIHECKRVEVYSKEKGGSWMWTYADLDEIESDPPKLETIPEPIEKKPSGAFVALAGKDSGTVVVWTKYDRQAESASKMLENMKVWFGRTYRHFIWDGIEIEVNGEEVKVIDPLFVKWEKTGFPNDPPGELFKEITIPWPVPEELRETYGKAESIVRVKLSLVHPSLRQKQGAGGSDPATARHIDDNEGVSILRNGREVLYGPIPYWPGGQEWFTWVDRWWGCEISFDAVLDRAFTVKNIKRGAVPNADLKQAIYDRIKPTVLTCREKVRELWNETKQEEIRAKKQGPVTDHDEAERIAGETPTDKSQLDKDKDILEEAQKLVKKLRKGDSEAQQAAWVAKWTSQPFTIHDDLWTGPEFFEANHLGGKDVIAYNKGHVFFEQLYAIIEQLKAQEPLNEQAVNLKNLIDLLIISYSKAEAKFEKDLSFTVDEFVEQLRMAWGQYLQSYMRTWLKENGSDRK